MPKRILIVEDDRAARRAMALLVAKLGLIPVEASSIAQALMLLARAIDVICLDLRLPDGNGLEILQQVRHEGLSAKVAVISGADDPALLTAVTVLNPDAIFGKPLDVEDFLSWLDSTGIAPTKSQKGSWQAQAAQQAIHDHHDLPKKLSA